MQNTEAAASSLAGPQPSTYSGAARSSGRWLRIGFALAAVVLIGFAGMRFSAKRSAPQIHYDTLAIDKGRLAAKVSASGALSALVTVSVGSQVSGRIDSLRADFGSSVHKGQVIATIEPSLLQAAAQQARANYAAARAAVERARAQRINSDRQAARARALYAQRLIAAADNDQAEAGAEVARAELKAARSSVEQAKAARDQAELNLHYATIVSPIDGIVISRNVDVGQTVAATLQAPTLFTIAQDLTRMQVDTNVAEADVGKIREGMAVSFTVDAYPERVFPGRVRQVRDNAQTLQNVVTYDAVIDVDNRERKLKPGMTASVTFVYADKAEVVRVPNAALRFRPERALLSALKQKPDTAALPPGVRTLWLLRDGAAKPTRVRVGISDGVFTELLEGPVRPGDMAVTEAAAGPEKPGA
jgi:HlyD family secretion protein